MSVEHGPGRRVRVARRTPLAQDICGFEFVDADGAALPTFSAGAHIDVHLPGGLVRQYSLCNDTRETHRYEIAVLLDPASRGGSRALHGVREGDVIRIGDPRNHFPLDPAARHHRLFAGGIGITPLLCMAAHLAGVGASFDLHYCTRSPQRTAFADRIRTSPFADRAQFHFDDGPAQQRLDLGVALARPTAGTHLYVCGPAGFMEAVLAAARAAGWPEAVLHREYFAGAPAAEGGDAPFEVQLASSGRVVQVAAGQTVVAALEGAGVSVPVSCEQGVCGTCLTRVISGTPDHRDVYLTEDEHERGDQFTPCCSRAKSKRLVLDL